MSFLLVNLPDYWNNKVVTSRRTTAHYFQHRQANTQRDHIMLGTSKRSARATSAPNMNNLDPAFVAKAAAAANPFSHDRVALFRLRGRWRSVDVRIEGV
jgi:hypothetical protein